ncbi:MAG: carboxypeptidase regulatory-like domain-containing protein [Desulfobacterales bacterium]|nr:carboxypeptidase regulatory-like domain-containing protein [Desulfobacterales bacterium]
MNKIKVIFMALLAASLLCFFNEATAGTIKGKVTAKGIRNASNVVVYIDTMAGEFKPPEKHFAMDQKNMAFIPSVLPVLAGATVDFLNSDDVLHNVLTTNECAEKFNLGTWGKGESRSYTFKNTGCRAVMLCNVHPEMEGWVVTLQNPYFFKTGKDGAFIIENVPTGKYTLNVWHSKAEGPSQEVSVPQEGEVTVDFRMMRKR